MFGNTGLPRLGSTLQIQVLSGFSVTGSAGITTLLTGASNSIANGFRLPFGTSVLSSSRTRWCGFLDTSADEVIAAPIVGAFHDR